MKAYISYHVDRINKTINMNISYEDGKRYSPNMRRFGKDINLHYKDYIDLILGKFRVDVEPNYDKILFRITVNGSDIDNVINLLNYYKYELLYSEVIVKLIESICRNRFTGE